LVRSINNRSAWSVDFDLIEPNARGGLAISNFVQEVELRARIIRVKFVGDYIYGIDVSKNNLTF
jgi:hypothetical protein